MSELTDRLRRVSATNTELCYATPAMLKAAASRIEELEAAEAVRPTESLGYVLVNKDGVVCSYVHYSKPENAEWPESWDRKKPSEAPHTICALVPVGEVK